MFLWKLFFDLRGDIEIKRKLENVLILVFMEVILLHESKRSARYGAECFNPCFYGSYSFTLAIYFDFLLNYLSFNPCFYGSYSFTALFI